jgi:para-nitrobenzyl esterase
MVWIHGGALSAGSSEVYDPVALVARGVVVVTINYRWARSASWPTGRSRPSRPGRGRQLRPARPAGGPEVGRGQHRHFGGNPRNVTIFGESAGGLSVHSHLASPLAAGLFDKAIVESGAYQLNQAPLADRRDDRGRVRDPVRLHRPDRRLPARATGGRRC